MTDTPALPAAAAPATPAVAPVYAPPRNLSVIALVLGIASVLLGYTFIVPIAAIVVGVLGYRREPTGHTLAVWGIVLGAVMAFGWIVAGFFGLLFSVPFFFVGLF
jgi:hypothetical protein